MSSELNSLVDLPGGELVTAGLADVAAGRVSAEACLVAMVAPHLHRVGIDAARATELVPEPERTLYALLAGDASGRNPYPRYNALKRSIVSFARALALRDRCQRASGSGSQSL